jgi:hypothetical protein
MAFDAGSPDSLPQPPPDEPTPWWEWASRIIGGGALVVSYSVWLIHTLGSALTRAFGG